VTLQTIADRVGVSRMTVSNAFSRPDQLSTDLRARILAAADELGYAGPDPAARVLATGATGAVGVLLTESLQYAFSDEVAALFLGAIADELAPTGLALTLLSTTGPEGRLPARDVPLDGAFVYSCADSSPSVDWLERRRLPLVYVDQVPRAGAPSINIDDRGGARAAAQHVIDLGHRRVALVSLDLDGPEGVIDEPLRHLGAHVPRQRMLGWLDALDAAGITPIVVHSRQAGDQSGRVAAELVLRGPDRPTAVLCYSDAGAYGVVQAALELGLRVPDDVSVVGFDDNPLAQRMHPPLTTVRQDVREKGRRAARALVEAIERARNGTGPGRPRRVVLPTELVVRSSTARPPARPSPAASPRGSRPAR
jgi:DNA-binding LacI/PurR family transcriptional regulator